MRIAVVGSGGREHALLWKLKQSAYQPKLFALPGNPGMREVSELVATSLARDSLAQTIRDLGVDLVVVGPEQPLADGISDAVERLGIRCFGPTASAARLESSKVFAKELMRERNVPTAPFAVFDDFYALSEFVQNHPREQGRVIKADGLAAGKGAFVCKDDDEVLEVAHRLLIDHELGEAGAKVVLEEKLAGREASLHFFCDGERYVMLPPAQDYKRAHDADQGPNTGGMGTLCPAAHVTSAVARDVERKVVEPVLRALRERGAPYRGMLYVGVMLTEMGPQVIEFNCRFGDPETQVILPCLSYDPVDAMIACVDGALNPQDFSNVSAGAAVCVVLAASGYPGEYAKGIPLQFPECNGQQALFAAGVERNGDVIVSKGGRVLNAVGLGQSIRDAREQAYELAEKALVPGLRMRTDIAAPEAS